MVIEIHAPQYPMSPIEEAEIRRTIASALRHYPCELVRIWLVHRDGSRTGRPIWMCQNQIASGRPDEGLLHAVGFGSSVSSAVHDACAGAERALVAARFAAAGPEAARPQAA